MNYEASQSLSHSQFKRRFGVQKATFKRMVNGLSAGRPPVKMRGRPHKLSVENRILLALEYRTYFHIATDWAVSESTICRIVHRVETELMASGLFRIPGKKRLIRGFGQYEMVVMDVTETPIERPKHKQKAFYSGKKKYHTLKCQVIIDKATLDIICLYFGDGRTHDFKLFKTSGVHFDPDTKSLEDSGYQGMARYHANCFLPQKKPKNGDLSESDREYNRALGSERVCIEHVNRRLKVFKILALRYRNRRRRYGLRFNLIAALYNHDRSLVAC